MTRRHKPEPEIGPAASARRYRRVETSLWTDAKYLELSGPPPSARYLWHYLLTGPRTTVFPGLVVATPAVIGSDLGWPVDRDLFSQGTLPVDNLWTRAGDASPTHPGTRLGRVPQRVCTCVRDALSELVEKGMIEFDSHSPIILLTKALFTAPGVIRGSNKPGSANQLISWEKSWAEVPECTWKDRYLENLEAFCDGASKAMGNAFRKAFATHLGTRPLPETGSGSGSGSETGSDQRSEREELGGEVDHAPSGDPGDVTIAHGTTRAHGGDPRDNKWDNAADTLAPVIPLLAHIRAPAPAAASRGTTAASSSTPVPATAPRGTIAEAHPGASTRRAAAGPASDPHALEVARSDRRTKAWSAWQRMNRERTELSAELGLEPPTLLHHHLDGYKQLTIRIAESGDDAAEHLEKVFRVAAAVARASRSLRYFGPCMFGERAWEAKLAMSFEDAIAEASPPQPGGASARSPSPRRSPAGPSRDPSGRNVFDAVDQATRAIEARLGDATHARDGTSRDVISDSGRREPRSVPHPATAPVDVDDSDPERVTEVSAWH